MKRALLPSLLLSLACRSGTTPAVSAPPVQPAQPAQPAPAASATPAPAPSAAAASFPMTDAMHWMRNSAEYEAAARQTYRFAAQKLESAVKGKAAGSWAVILDADETVLDNSQYLKERNEIGERFTPATWNQWTKRKSAGSVPGAQGFLKRIQELGGRIAIVTNRAASECPDTETNFRSLGLPYDVILCNPDVRAPAKQPRFDQVSKGTTAAGLPPLEVVMWVGDNIQDFPGMTQDVKSQQERLSEFGERFFVLPNPTYGSWERLPRK